MGSIGELRTAIDAGQLVLHYQPIVDLASGQPRGVEALVRWQHPGGGLLSPDDFLPAVENLPVMTELTRWVLRTSCAAAASWPGWRLSVNVSARDLVGTSLVDSVAEALSSAWVAADRLVLEVTETALVQDLAHAAHTLGTLRERGVAVALDDFGTGYSSMLYLRDLPVSEVKIDREFIAGLDGDSDDRAIVTSLLTLARAIGLSTIAEGVENATQAQVLTTLGCPLAQGYWWCRPQPAAVMDAIYRDGLRAPAPAPRRPGPGTWPRSARVAQQATSMLKQGASLHTIAAALNAAGERTWDGTRWHSASVARLVSECP